MPELQPHIVSHFEATAQIEQLQVQARSRRKKLPVTTLPSFGDSQTVVETAALRSGFATAVEWWKLSPLEEAAQIADLLSALSGCAEWWKLSPEADAEIAELYSLPPSKILRQCSVIFFCSRTFESSNVDSLLFSQPHGEVGHRGQCGTTLPPRRGTGAGGEADLEQVKQLAESAAELALSTEATVRVHDATLLRTWMVPALSQYAVSGLQTGKDYHEAVKNAGCSHGLGSPHLHVWAALTMTAKSDRFLKESKQAEWKTHATTTTNPKELDTLVTVCNMRPASNKEFGRLQLKITPLVECIAAIFETAFRHLGGEQKHGIAPTQSDRTFRGNGVESASSYQ